MTGGVVRINTLQAVGRWRSWHFRPSPWGPLSSARTASAWRLGRPPMTPAKHTPPRRWWPTPKSVVITADGSKIGIVTFARMAGLADIHDLVTDITAPPPPPPTSTNTSPPDPPHNSIPPSSSGPRKARSTPPCSSITGEPKPPGRSPKSSAWHGWKNFSPATRSRCPTVPPAPCCCFTHNR
jgi:hypothetical protein